MQSDVYIQNFKVLNIFLDAQVNYSGARFNANDAKVVGNGGLSLRKVEYFLRHSRNLMFKVPLNLRSKSLKWKIMAKAETLAPYFKRFYLNGRINEDLIWSLFTFDKSRHVNEVDDYIFAVENIGTTDLTSLNKNVFGYHAWEKYLPLNLQIEIREKIYAI